MAPRIVDADGHVRERDEVLLDYLEGRHKGMLHDPTHRFFPSISPSTFALRDPSIHDADSVYTDGEVWLSVLDQLGIEQTVLYPTAGLGHGQIRDPDWACALAHAYNRWVSDCYCRVSSRLRAVALLPMQDVSAAVAELRYAVTQLDMVAGFLCSGNGLREPYGHPEFDPVWAEAERLGVPLVLHGHAGETQWLSLHLFDTRTPKIHALAHPFKNIVQLTSIVMDGVFERFPGSRVAVLESGSGWVAWMMDRLDFEYRQNRKNRRADFLQKRPSEYIREHVYASCDLEEALLPATIERLGEDHLLFASDYPHDAPAWIQEDLEAFAERADISEAAKQQILGENALRFYRLDRER